MGLAAFQEDDRMVRENYSNRKCDDGMMVALGDPSITV